jgi:hypothetical protein
VVKHVLAQEPPVAFREHPLLKYLQPLRLQEGRCAIGPLQLRLDAALGLVYEQVAPGDRRGDCMSKDFCLLDEPWLPVRLADGRVVDLGLREVFQRSGEIVALAETAPPSLVAQYRLLLAITHRALTRAQGHWRPADRVRWFREGLPCRPVQDYLDHWRDHFALFHPQQPFLQVAALAEAPRPGTSASRGPRSPWPARTATRRWCLTTPSTPSRRRWRPRKHWALCWAFCSSRPGAW